MACSLKLSQIHFKIAFVSLHTCSNNHLAWAHLLSRGLSSWPARCKWERCNPQGSLSQRSTLQDECVCVVCVCMCVCLHEAWGGHKECTVAHTHTRAQALTHPSIHTHKPPHTQTWLHEAWGGHEECTVAHTHTRAQALTHTCASVQAQTWLHEAWGGHEERTIAHTTGSGDELTPAPVDGLWCNASVQHLLTCVCAVTRVFFSTRVCACMYLCLRTCAYVCVCARAGEQCIVLVCISGACMCVFGLAAASQFAECVCTRNGRCMRACVKLILQQHHSLQNAFARAMEGACVRV